MPANSDASKVAAFLGLCPHSPGRVWGAASWGCECGAPWRSCKAASSLRQPFSLGMCVFNPDVSPVCLQLLVGALVPVDGRGLFVSTLQASHACNSSRGCRAQRRCRHVSRQAGRPSSPLHNCQVPVPGLRYLPRGHPCHHSAVMIKTRCAPHSITRAKCVGSLLWRLAPLYGIRHLLTMVAVTGDRKSHRAMLMSNSHKTGGGDWVILGSVQRLAQMVTSHLSGFAHHCRSCWRQWC